MSLLPQADTTLLVRTDFSDPTLWAALQTAISTPNEDGFLASAHVIDDRTYQDLTTEELLARVPKDARYRLLAVADKTTLHSSELPLLIIDLFEEGPHCEIRVIASSFWSIENNLSLANMDFFEFAGAVDDDNIFRGF